MLLEILRLARSLDKKLESKLGRPYRVVLSVALITEIVEEMRQLSHASFTKVTLIQTLIWILVGVLLLINQLGEMANRMDNRPKRLVRGRGRAVAGAAEGSALPPVHTVTVEDEDTGGHLAD